MLVTAHTQTTALNIALVGNPNTGKSTLFTALVGVHQHVGNYPGVTVEKKTGRTQFAGVCIEVIDLPGLYSIRPQSRDEAVAVRVLLGQQADCPPLDAVVCLADACNMRRGLYLLGQVLELGIPAVLAVTMLDVAATHGVQVDLKELERRLGLPVVGVQAHRRLGIEALKAAVLRVAAGAQRADGPATAGVRMSSAAPADTAGSDAQAALPVHHLPVQRRTAELPIGLSSTVDCINRSAVAQTNSSLGGSCTSSINSVSSIAEVEARYHWVEQVLSGVLEEPTEWPTTFSDRLDELLMHRFWGLPIFALLMLAVFQTVFVGARPLVEAIELGCGWCAAWVESHLAEGALRSLLIDGVISGVGSVLSFLPPIAILFLFIGLLEGCGYMARAAVLMDRWMSQVGLSGKSFIPMLSSFACAIPGIMATRVIENERDRLATILVTPLLTCSARLPLYTLLIAAFIPERRYLLGFIGLQGLTLAAMYALGILAAAVAATVVKRTLLRGATTALLIELPSYKWPVPRVLLGRIAQRCLVFLRNAATLILAASIVVWAGLYYPRNTPTVLPLEERLEQLDHQLAELPADDHRRAELEEQRAALADQIEGEYQRHSLLGYFGRWMEPVFRPLGWDWRIGCAVMASFPAREVVVATLGVMFNAGRETDEQQHSARLQTQLLMATWEGTDRPLFTLPVALSLMVFFALCAQCAATLAVIKRETNSWRWPAFVFVYMTTLAYLGAMLTYQIGTLLGA